MIPNISIRKIIIDKKLLIVLFAIPNKLDKMPMVNTSYALYLNV